MSFFVCCCRPCLRGQDDATEFYRLLDVPKDASPEDIRRAYKKKSLQMHPDKLAQRGQTLSPADQARFQRMKEAYECLNDPKRRRLYDELGEVGMRAVEDPQSVNPEVLLQNFLRSSTGDRCYIFSMVLAVTAFLLLWPVLLCLRVDKTINIPWTALWTPIWIFDFVIFSILAFAVSLGRIPPPEGEEVSEHRDDFPQRVLALVQFSANVLFQIFLTLKLDKDVTWPWRVVFSPWLVWEGLSLLGNITIAMSKIPPELAALGDEQRILMMRFQIAQAQQAVFNGILRIIFVILIILRLDHEILSSWWAVTTPLWIYFGILLLSVCFDCTRAKLVRASLDAGADVEAGMQGQAEELREEANMISSRACMNCCYFMILLTVAILAVERIPDGGGNASYSVFVVFTPFFIIIGCLVCSMGITICTLRDPGELGEGAGEGTPLNPGAVSTQQDVGAGGGGYKSPSPTPEDSAPITQPSGNDGGGASSQPAVAPSEVVLQVPSTQEGGGGAELEGID